MEKGAKTAFVFPGQGSQVVGMGLDLYLNSPGARQLFDEADRVLGFPLSRLCFDGPEDELCQTVNAQPAIMTVSLACFQAASETLAWPEPAFVAGHSLGEYTALVVAGVLDFAEAVCLVRERGRLMQEVGQMRPGGMAAVVGLDEASLEEVCLETGARISNINSPDQIVISGARGAVARAMDLARARGARRVIQLEVSGAFHSPLMRPVADGMARALSRINLRHPMVPVVVNSTARPVTSAGELEEELLQQLCHCVHWWPSVKYMVGAGVDTFVEVGPGRVLSGLIKRINQEVQVLNLSDMASIKAMNW